MLFRGENRTDNMEDFASDLAQDFEAIRNDFYLITLFSLGDSLRTQAVTYLTDEGHFVIASFQLWTMFNHLDAKREKYLPPTKTQDFVNWIYAKVIWPYYSEVPSPEEAAKGVSRFDALAKEDSVAPYREFISCRLKEIVFSGLCDITGYYRSSLALGIHITLGDDLGMLVGFNHATAYLIHATQKATAEAFGDKQLAAEQEHELEKLRGVK